MRTLIEHLELYGISHFKDDSYWTWGGQVLGPRLGRQLNTLRRPLGRNPSEKKLLQFYDFIAEPTVASVVHSMKADAIHSTGTAVEQKIAGCRKILDLGCNIGYLTTWYGYIEASRQVTGLDFSRRSIEIARRKANELQIHEVRFEMCDIRSALPEGSFDCVIDTQTLSYISDLDCTMRLIRSALDEGGRLISVAAAGRAEIAKVHLARLTEAGFRIRKFEWVEYSDLGICGAYPLLVADLDERSGIEISLEDEYNRELTRLQE